ncbi:hypothetical protein MY4038_006637 [Beauveria bassiana]
MPLSLRQRLPKHLVKYTGYASDWRDVRPPEISLTATSTQIHNAIVNFIEAFETTDLDSIFIYYIEDFEFWTLETFEKADQQVLRWFRDWLRDHGIFVTRQLGCTKALFNLARHDIQPAWVYEKEVIEELVKAPEPLTKAQEKELVKAQEQELVKAQEPEPPEGLPLTIKANFQEPPEATVGLFRLNQQHVQRHQYPRIWRYEKRRKRRWKDPVDLVVNLADPVNPVNLVNLVDFLDAAG